MIVEDLSGRGELVVDQASSYVDYSLTVRQRGGLKDGEGEVAGQEPALHSAFMSDNAMLALDDGRVAPIIITRYLFGQGRAEFKLAGAITGPAQPYKA